MFKGDDSSSKQSLRTYGYEAVFFAFHAYIWLIFNQYKKFTEMHSSVCFMKCH